MIEMNLTEYVILGVEMIAVLYVGVHIVTNKVVNLTLLVFGWVWIGSLAAWVVDKIARHDALLAAFYTLAFCVALAAIIRLMVTYKELKQKNDEN